MVGQKLIIGGLIGVLLIVVAIVVAMHYNKSSEKFDVNVDPVRSGYKQNIYSCPASAETQGNGLNAQDGASSFTVRDFMEKFKGKLVYPENDPMDVVPRQYCALMYENFHEDFSNNWESLGICEQDVKEQLTKSN